MWVMTEIRQELKAILKIQQETATKVDELYTRIFVNNGKPSLVSTVEDLEKRMTDMESVFVRRDFLASELHGLDQKVEILAHTRERRQQNVVSRNHVILGSILGAVVGAVSTIAFAHFYHAVVPPQESVENEFNA